MKRIDLNEHEGDDNIIKFPSLKKSQPPPSSPGEKFSATWAGIDLQSSEGKQSFKFLPFCFRCGKIFLWGYFPLQN